MARLNSKSSLTQQRAALRREAKGKTFVGDDTGSAAARAAELSKVHEMQRSQRRRQEHERLVEQPVLSILGSIAWNGAKLAGAVVTLPFRMAGVFLLGHRPGASQA